MPSIRNTHPGDRIHLEAWIVRHNNGQTIIELPGVGESGQWQVPGSTLVDVISDVDPEVRRLRRMLMQAGINPDKADVTGVIPDGT